MFRISVRRENHQYLKRVLLYIKSGYDVLQLFRCKSHYTSLGVDANATPQEIKSAYYKLSLKHHPDKNKGSEESVQKFREISEAYEVLSNQNKKRVYDETLTYKNYESELRHQYYSPRSNPFKGRSPPRTGKTNQYDYDEHYKQHYEEYERQRQADFEYFKHRWNNEYRRRYPYRESPDWTEYQRQRDNFDYRFRLSFKGNKFFFFMAIWGTIFVLSLPFVEHKDSSDKTLYYGVKKEGNNTVQYPLYYKVETNKDEKNESED